MLVESAEVVVLLLPSDWKLLLPQVIRMVLLEGPRGGWTEEVVGGMAM